MPAIDTLKRHSTILFSALLLGILFADAQGNALTIQQARVLPDHRAELLGSLGPQCRQCEVILDYGGGFKYAGKLVSWQEQRVVFIPEDIGKTLQAKVWVQSPQGMSNAVNLSLQPRITPERTIRGLVPATMVDGKQVFAQQHQDRFGGKGNDQFDVNATPAQCGKETGIFDHAELFIDQRRFGDAKILSQPTAGCQRCQPVTVQWYHEPTGKISYQLIIYRRLINGICQDRIRP